MAENPDPADQLLEKLEILQEKQDLFAQEIKQLKREIYWIKREEAKKVFSAQNKVTVKESNDVEAAEIEVSEEREYSPPESQYLPPSYRQNPYLSPEEPEGEGSSVEKFIGENLINKIGIAITIIGVSIGVKYSIDHNLISPLTRILLGYLAGLGLLFFGIRLKTRFINYSAVLVSGSMAVLYFITYAAYTYYGLMSQVAAFVVMVTITIFTVITALKYDKMVIALIGQVGAYAIPFLLSDSGHASVLFSYMTIINAGLLVIAVKKYWEPLYYAAFVVTWLIFVSWFNKSYLPGEDFELSLVFLSLFFVIFYLTFLGYKVHQKREFDAPDLPLLLANSAIFYGLGYIILNGQKGWEEYLGLFTLVNALIHGGVSIVLYFRDHEDKNLIYFIGGLAIVFLTIAVPVQLDGNWVTLIWAGEMALLFWIGRVKKARLYEICAYPLMALTIFSLLIDWGKGYLLNGSGLAKLIRIPFFNIYILTSFLVLLSFGFLYLIDRNRKFPSSVINRDDLLKAVSRFIPAAFLVILFFMFRNEIAYYWNQLYGQSMVKTFLPGTDTYKDFLQNNDLRYFKTVWLLIYSFFYLSVLSYLNIVKLKDRILGLVTLGFNLLMVAIFLADGLITLGMLRDSYLTNAMAPYFQHGIFNLWIRYIAFLFLGSLLWISARYVRQDFLETDLKMFLDIVLHISILAVLSFELIHWMNIAGSAESNKLGLSILWGVYSLLLISLGIWKKKKHLRIGAIALFAATLLKLFFYDLTDLDTISKTIIFISLGILLLIISYIYNKYKNLISD